MAIENMSKIRTYNDPPKPPIRWHSHPDRPDVYVEMQVGEERFILLIDDVIKSVTNCRNV